MRLVARFSSEIRAQHAAAFLRDHGVPATVVGQHLSDTVPVPRARALDLVVAEDALREEALRLLEEFEREPATPDEGWEDAAGPDLSRLDPALPPVACPACGEPLPMDAARDHCQECGQPVDVARLVARAHGAEALRPCFEDESVWRFAVAELLEDAPAEPAPARCASCGADLPGGATLGRCASCGALYDLSDDAGRAAGGWR